MRAKRTLTKKERAELCVSAELILAKCRILMESSYVVMPQDIRQSLKMNVNDLNEAIQPVYQIEIDAKSSLAIAGK